MANKQTAVEYLLKNMYLITGLKWDEVIEQAKAMEKEQIINAFISGEHQQGYENEPEQYYEETYGK